MSDPITTERARSGFPWWLWLLLVPMVVGAIAWFLTRDVETSAERQAAAAKAARFDPAAVGLRARASKVAGSGPITDARTIIDATDRMTLVGREVALSGVQVLTVVGDRTFYVDAGDRRRLFVVLNEEPKTGNGVEGRYDVSAGQILDLHGSMQRADASIYGDKPIEGLPRGREVVFYAQSLRPAVPRAGLATDNRPEGEQPIE